MKFRHNPLSKRKLLAAAISMSLLPVAQQSLAQDSAIEEVVVTGSFIRRSEGFQNASPVTSIGADDIALAGTPNLGDVIHNLAFNAGTTVSANAFTGASNIATSLNLRGLGAGATLDLVDGIRTPSTNANTVLPQIAIQRLDIVTDGAAALYGNEAVAGVVNYVPYRAYDGFKFEHLNTQDDRGDYNDVQFQALFGTNFNGIDVVVAGSWREHSRLEMYNRPDTLRSAFVWSSTATPGDYRVPTRDANGVLTGSSRVLSDPACQFGSTGHEDPTVVGNGEFGFQRPRENCAYDYGEFWDYRYPTQQGVLFASASYEFSEDLSVNAQYNFGSVRHEVRGSPINPGGRVSELPVIRGEIPGNPYRAVDANGNALFAQDANGDGVPDRMGGDPFGTVILDPNGIPFNEDVAFASWRPWAKHGVKPAIFNSDGSSPRDGLNELNRIVLNADFTVPYMDGWEGRMSYMWGQVVDSDKEYDGSFSGLNQGLRCDVATEPEACFSPFADTSGVGFNTQAVADSTVNYARERNVDTDQTFDFVINGELLPSMLELPGGTVGMALGYQRRDEQFSDNPAPFLITGDAWIAAQEFNNGGGRYVDAFFAELSVPVLDNLELQLALRDEEYSTGQNSTDPKYGIVYQPTDWMTLRASKGTSFIAPSLNALTSPQSCGLNNIADPFTDFAAFTSSCNQGNPNLVPESADTLSAGIDLRWDNLTINLTYSETDFSDRIVSTNSQDILDNDFFNFEQAFGAVPAGTKPPIDQVAAWVADPRSDKRVLRDPNNLAEIIRVFQSQSNASSMLVEAYDVNVSYRFTLPFGLDNLGDWNANLSATYLDKYHYQLSARDPVVQAVGNRNNSTGAVPPMPRIKGNFRIGWVNGNHSAALTSNYLHQVNYDGFQGFFLGGLHSSVVPRTVTELRASHVEDFAYNYSNIDAFGGSVTLTVGSRNLFDRRPQRMAELGGTEERLYDAMGRTIYARVTFEL